MITTPGANDSSPTGGRLVSLPTTSETRTSVESLYDDFRGLADEVGVLADDTYESAAKSRSLILDERVHALRGRQMTWLVEQLSDYGLSWRDIARLIGVSVPALRKWRRGGAATPDNRLRACRLIAVFDYVDSKVPTIDDVAGWFETPLVPSPAVSPLDLLAADFEAEVLDYAEGRPTDPEELLTACDPDWRDRRSPFEVVMAADGHMSIQPKP